MRYDAWQIDELIATWQAYVASRNRWRSRRYGGYRVKSVDITGFWRPRLAGAVSKQYHALAQQALPAIVFGVMISSGQIAGKRVPLHRTGESQGRAMTLPSANSSRLG